MTELSNAQIPDDMPRTKPDAVHPIDGWEAEFAPKPELGVLRISHVPGSAMIGLFIRMDALMFPLAYFRNWHAAHRFAAWMEGATEPKPTLAEEYSSMMEKKIKLVEEAPGVKAVIQQGRMTFTATDAPVVPTPGLPRWPKDKDDE